MLIDIHPHVISSNTDAYPLTPLGGKQSDWSAEHPMDVEDMVKAMDEAGVAKSVLVQASSAYGYNNSYVADSVAKFPDRFTGVFSVDVTAKDAPAMMKKWMDRGLTGMRIFTSGSTQLEQATFFAHPDAYPAWQYASDNDIPVCMQMRMKGIPLLLTVLDHFPKVRVIIDHFARVEASDGPPYTAAKPVWELARYPNVYLKLTHRPIEAAFQGRATAASFFGKVVQEFGSERIAWGSNFPAAPLQLHELATLAKGVLAFLPQADQDQIFYKTALTLYPVLAKKF